MQHYVAKNAYGCNAPVRVPGQEFAKIPAVEAVENSGDRQR
jgi:hypothetical protein